MPHHRDHSHNHGHRPWWKSFRTTAAIGYSIRHYGGPWNAAVVERAGVRAGDRVVDIGCGPGESALLLARAAPGVRVVAVDPAWPCCAVTRLRSLGQMGRVRVRRGAAERLPVTDGWATLVLSVNAFHHWADPRRGLGEARRVLAPGGRLVLVDEDFPPDHHHTRFHREQGGKPPVHAGSPEVTGWLAGLGFTDLMLEKLEDADGTSHHCRLARTPTAGAEGGTRTPTG